MTSKLPYKRAFGMDSSHLTAHKASSRSSASNTGEPWQPDWLMILMVSLFVLTLLIAWLVDIPALLQ